MGGTFTLKYMESVTEAISCDARPEEIKTKVNAILPSFRSIEVEKLASSKHRHEWLITFPSEMGDIGMLIGDPNWLQGDGKDVIITEHVTGVTDMVGSFRLGLDAYTWTHGLRPDATAVEVENAIKGLEGVKSVNVTRQALVQTLTPPRVLAMLDSYSLPYKRILTGSITPLKIFEGDLSKYLNAYIGSAFGRGVPIFGTSMIDDSVLMDMQKEINTAIEVATVATGIDIRGHIVASNFFIVICCNGSSIVGKGI